MKKKNVLELAITGIMPFVSIALLFLIRFVSLGFKLPDAMYWADMCVNVAMMLCFFIPFKSIFKEKYMASELVGKKKEYYSVRVGAVFNNRIVMFDEWTKQEFEKRRNDYIKMSLLRFTMLSSEEFMSKYRMSPKLILKDKNLTVMQKYKLIKLVFRIWKIKPIKASKCLPSTDNVRPDARITSNMNKTEKILMIKRVAMSFVLCAGIAMIVIKPSALAGNITALITEFLLKMLMGCWYVYGASRVAYRLVYKEYMNELAEKSLVLDEFLETQKGWDKAITNPVDETIVQSSAENKEKGKF